MTLDTMQLQRIADADHDRQPVCSWCGKPGEPYEYRGVRFDGLTACQGARLCPPCTDRYLDTTPLLVRVRRTTDDPGRVYDINPLTATEETEPPAQAIAPAYRYADWRPPRRGNGRAKYPAE